MDTPLIEEPPASRATTILGSFLRGRPRNSSQSHIHTNNNNSEQQQQNRDLSPQPPPSPNPGGRRRPPLTPQTSHHNTNTNSNSSGSSGGLAFSNMLRRRRSAGNVVAAQPSAAAVAAGGPGGGSTPIAPPPPALPIPIAASTTAPASSTPATGGGPSSATARAAAAIAGGSNTPGSSHRIRLVPHIDNRRNLRFEAITRDLKEGDSPLRIGRFTDRSGLGLAAVNAMNSNKLAFKSKVVSRAHAEIWCEAGSPHPKFYIKDTKSSSGTFLNHIRLSPANTESKPFQLKDGDILQLGVDYQGGTEDIYKSVKIRLELGREWQATANAFNTNAIKSLKALAGPLAATAGGKPTPSGKKTQLGDCCICLFPVTIRQSLFITPCSHTFHYKCIRPLLETHHPAFCCPLCRTFADLEEDVEVEVEDGMELDEDDDEGSEVAAAAGEDVAGAAAAAEGEPSGTSGGGLAPPPKENNGAETEVEGDNGAGPSNRMRVSTPLTDEVPEEDDIVLLERPTNTREEFGERGAGPMDVDSGAEGGGVTPLDDVDGTVGGKRKR